MRRKPTKNTRGPVAPEVRFMNWCHDQECIICWTPPPIIADHCKGATFRHNKVLIGMWFILPYCYEHDQVKTQGSARRHFKEFGFTQSSLWLRFIERYPNRHEIPDEVIAAIKDWNR